MNQIINKEKKIIKGLNDEVLEYGTCLKIDYDYINLKYKLIRTIAERLLFLEDVGLLKINQIIKIYAFKKTNYGVKIYIKENTNPINIIILQAIMGDDYKRVGVTYRDYLLKIKNYNRLFDMKKYVNNDFIQALEFDITKKVLNYIKQKLQKQKENNK